MFRLANPGRREEKNWLVGYGQVVAVFFFAGRGGPGWNTTISEGLFALLEVASQKLASQNLM